jgi:adenine C2-methylase RlmN of 23S rRNA A2503 and tRNA A37
MKTSVFEKLIRKVVREEIDYALQREIRSLKEDLRNELKPTIKEQPIQRTPIPERVQSSLKEKIMGKKLKKQSFVSNNTLNEPFNTADPIPVETMPTSVANVVNRDYRGLMKAIENKKGR